MALILILNDQLSHSLSSLQHASKDDVIFFCELKQYYTHVKHHQKKIAFLIAAMRHFADELRIKGLQVHYVELDAKGNTGDLQKEVSKVIKEYQIDKLIITKPSEYYLYELVQQWPKQLKIDVDIKDDDRFLCSDQQFQQWVDGKKQLRMEYFYRWMRQQHQILMQGKKPMGGQWNYDTDNRKKPNKDLVMPTPYKAPIDQITQDAINLTKQYFSDHFGDLEPFYFAVTRKGALKVLNMFIKQRLHLFGDFQDAMLENEPWMFHSHISFYLNCGLLVAEECIKKVEQAYHDGMAPLNAVEGFIRQILGWREYIRGIYWLKMPMYEKENYLKAKLSLPKFYWTAETDLNCLKQCITETKQNAYAHHIQRLMVLGNFALLIGADPDEVNEWYWIVYADAFQWVELPNVTGMILFADNGLVASKPYAASGAYINKMSNYCKSCKYSVKEKVGEDACPYNYLYWNFMAKHEKKFEQNPRMSFVYRTYNKMTDEKKQQIKKSSLEFLKKMK